MYRRLIARATIALTIVLFLFPSTASSFWFPLSKITSPKRLERLDDYPVSIEVKFHKNARLKTFRAWLNGKNITAKFQFNGRTATALVTPDDGLRYREKSRPPRGRAVNWLKTKVRGKRRTLDVDHRIFFVIIEPQENHPPVADAGADQTVKIGDMVTLDGSGSTDVDGDALTYQWELIPPEGSGALLSDDSAIKPTFQVDHKGPFTAELTVNDGQLDSTPDQVEINTENSPPVADIGVWPEGTLHVGTEVLLDGSGSSDPDDDPIVDYKWSLVGKPGGSSASLGDVTGDFSRKTLTPDIPGDYLVQLIVNDGDSDSDPVQVTVTTDNQPPVAVIGGAPAEPLHDGSLIALDGNASQDPDGDPIIGYDWSLISQPADSATQLSAGGSTCTFTPDKPGDYVVQLIVSDAYEAGQPVTQTVTLLALIPNVTGLSQDNAETQLSEAGLTVGNVSEQYDDNTAAGIVLSQSLSAGDYFPAGTPVGLVVSLGPEPVNVPNVVGSTQSAAESAIRGAGLTVGTETTASSDTVPAGSVISQDPAADTPVAPRTAIDLVVSSGPSTVAVPNVVGSTQSAAESAIADASLTVGTVTTTSSDTVPAGRVISQNPVAGTPVAPGSAVNLEVSSGPEGIPPDPADVAPPLDPTVPTDFHSATEFLYTGSDPIQTGVLQNAIDPRRSAVLRGRVLSMDGNPLFGVVISILGHPELGQTVTRTDGMFDLAVNGGGMLTVTYTKAGYFSAQRKVDVPWRDYAWVSDVVMVAQDTQATDIVSNNASAQIASGSVVTDTDGSRSATVYFPAGTQAQFLLPDGSVQGVSTFTFRATEYSVGSNGPAAMPAELPSTSAYTYCVELSADQTPQGARLEFNRPVSFYVENFLNIPVGKPVPAGYYDRLKGIWVPVETGLVIKVLEINSDMASLDVTGDDSADTGLALDDLGITAEERTQLATRFQAGDTFWRVRLEHFTPLDCNFPSLNVSEGDYSPPPEDETEKIDGAPQDGGWGAIDALNQIFHEDLAVSGTPFNLHYSSNRVKGRLINNTIEIPLRNWSSPPLRLIKVVASIEVAGQRHHISYDISAGSTPPERYTFTWDGLDGYGRRIQGARPARVIVSNIYFGPYQEVSRFLDYGTGIGYPSMTSNPPRGETVLSRRYTRMLSSLDAQGFGLGGWMLNRHHVYDPVAGILYRGDGSTAKAQSLNTVIKAAAGVPEPWNAGNFSEGQPAVQAPISQPGNVISAADGSIYFTETGDYGNPGTTHSGNYIRRVTPDGSIFTVATPDTLIAMNYWLKPFYAIAEALPKILGPDSAMAAIAFPEGFTDIAMGPDGTLYASKTCSVFRLNADNTLTRIAGTGDDPYGDNAGFSGDGGPATSAKLGIYLAIAVDPEGNLFISDYDNHRIRRVWPDGLITTVVGTGAAPDGGSNGDNGPAAGARLYNPMDIAFAADGTLYIVTRNDIGNEGALRRVRPDGTITTVISSAGSDHNEGIDASTAYYKSGPMAVASDGSLYIAHDNVVRRIGSDGTIRTIAGVEGEYGSSGDGGPPRQARFTYFSGLAVGPDGTIYVADSNSDRVRQIHAVMPRFSISELLIPDGNVVHRFDSTGRHLATLHALTGETLLTFGYDAKGRLISITDADGNETAINRDASGNPASISAPFGQITTLSLNADGYLDGLTNPANETINMKYSAQGLLASVTGPRGNQYDFSFDSLGRLIRADDPADGHTLLDRTKIPDGYEITKTTALGRGTTYRVENAPSGDRTRTVVTPDGLTHQTVIKTDGSSTTTLPDGTVIDLVQGPDPRFGLLAPILASYTRTSPDGIETNRTLERTVVLTDPDDVLSVESLTDTRTLNGRTFTTVYDGATRTFTGTSAEGRISTRQIDTKGRIIHAQMEDLAATTLAYNTNGFLTAVTRGTGGDTRTGNFSYDLGRLSTATDAASRQTSFTYDAANRVTSLILPGNLILGYAYDASGNRTSVTPPEGVTHTFDFNGLDLLVTYTAPDISLPSEQTGYAYNDDRQLTTVTRPDGLQITNAFDTAGRLSTITTPTDSTTRAFDDNGRLTSISRAGATLTYGYDGSLLTSRTWSGPVSGTVSYAYNDDLQVTSVGVNGTKISYTYDNDGLLTTAGALSFNRENSANHLVTGTSLGSVSHTFGYNGFGDLAAKSAQTSTDTLYDCQYTRDKLGRIAQKVETIGGVATAYNYSYDDSGRLVGVNEGGTPVESFTYDGNGNRVTSGSATATYDHQDRLINYGTATYSYTDNGELTRKTDGSGTTTYSYDVLGNLMSVTLPDNTLIEYVVDGTGRRIVKMKAGTLVRKFLYAGPLNPVAELDASDSVVSRFVYGLRSNTPEYMVKGGQTYRIISDHLGSVRLVVNTADGTIAQRMDYDVFGNVLSDTHPGFQPFGFAGGLYDSDTGLVRFGARDYDPQTGRWTAKDPLRFAGSPLNFYVYVSNDPVNLVDPLGLGPGGFLSEEDYNEMMQSIDDSPLVKFWSDIDNAAREFFKPMFIPGPFSLAVAPFGYTGGNQYYTYQQVSKLAITENMLANGELTEVGSLVNVTGEIVETATVIGVEIVAEEQTLEKAGVPRTQAWEAVAGGAIAGAIVVAAYWFGNRK